MKNNVERNKVKIAMKGNSNLKKGSKLKPDAPEFVPLASQADSTKTPAKADSRTSSKAQRKKEKGDRKEKSSMSKKVGKAAGKRVDQSGGR